MKQTGEHALRKGKEGVENLKDNLKDRAESTYDKVKETGEHAFHKGKEGVENLKDNLKDRAESTYDKVKETGKHAIHRGKEGVESLKENLEDRADSAYDKVKETGKHAFHKGKNLKENAEPERAENLNDRVDSAFDKFKNRIVNLFRRGPEVKQTESFSKTGSDKAPLDQTESGLSSTEDQVPGRRRFQDIPQEDYLARANFQRTSDKATDTTERDEVKAAYGSRAKAGESEIGATEPLTQELSDFSAFKSVKYLFWKVVNVSKSMKRTVMGMSENEEDLYDRTKPDHQHKHVDQKKGKDSLSYRAVEEAKEAVREAFAKGEQPKSNDDGSKSAEELMHKTVDILDTKKSEDTQKQEPSIVDNTPLPIRATKYVFSKFVHTGKMLTKMIFSAWKEEDIDEDDDKKKKEVPSRLDEGTGTKEAIKAAAPNADDE
jgi:hypothetical protein